MVVGAFAFAWNRPAVGCPAAVLVAAATAKTKEATTAPVCVKQGTRSEGWAWPDGKFIRWGKCKGVVPVCKPDGQGKEGEGWYDRAGLIANASCVRGPGAR